MFLSLRIIGLKTKSAYWHCRILSRFEFGLMILCANWDHEKEMWLGQGGGLSKKTIDGGGELTMCWNGFGH